ncbi:Auxin-induced protein 6B [Hibiscus syriacus]|uniref:Auxin-induced protein 6B n=1 Tax=Hibiscus syriacus TaxID=106335 RepID=A0A6A3BKD4_HIBSY|nr:Auxin-induced protein 6B [Hibiscus syriacus]
MSATGIPSDVPSGHVAVCVGTSCRRFVVRVSYLNHPVFKKFLIQAEEEYGLSNQGLLTIPCDESVFEEVIRFISSSESGHSGGFVGTLKRSATLESRFRVTSNEQLIIEHCLKLETNEFDRVEELVSKNLEFRVFTCLTDKLSQCPMPELVMVDGDDREGDYIVNRVIIPS